jgi:ABC-2 type transport system ATP-binding protein
MLVVDRVRKVFGSVVAVNGVSFTIGNGKTFGLLGPNGAGKTTTMRMILSIVLPDGGSIRWNDEPIAERTRIRFGYLPEERGLYGRIRVRDHIVYFARLHGVSARYAKERADTWIERLKLNEYADRPCAELSKGNQQKVQVACAAVHRPELLILDEPFSGLDPVNAGILFDVLDGLRKKGTTLVLSSHEMWQLERLCTDFCIISHGETRAAGTLEELRSAWPTRRIRVAPAGEAVHNILREIPQARLLPSENGSLSADLPRDTDLASLLRSLVAADRIVSFEPLEPSLQDIYLRAVGSA